MEPNTSSPIGQNNPKPQELPAKSNLTLLLILFFCLIVLSLAWMWYSQVRHEMKADEILNRNRGMDTAMPSGYKTKALVLGGKNFTADVSDTDELRELGLSGRAMLGDSQAMIFEFPQNGIHKFWMKDMFFEIDMIWLNDKKEIVHIEKSATPDSYPKTFGPNGLSRYVIEAESGISDELGLKVGDKVEF